MMNQFIPVNEPLLNGNEKKYLIECIETGWISSEGPFVKVFEERFAARMGRKHGIAVSNGTAALDAAIEALSLGSGDEIIVPAFTIISCVNQIVRNGATPVLVDSDPLTWNMDVSQIEAKITIKTKAIMVVHIYGMPVDMEPILNLCNRFGLLLIEDAAEAIGQNYRSKPCGSFGDISTVSFYPNKHITTGEGGMILTDDDELAEKCRELRNLCFKTGKRFVHEELGWNLRMTNLQAAIGVAQLERLDEFLLKKKVIGEYYNHLLADIPNIQLPIKSDNNAENLYWVYGMVVDPTLGLAEELMHKFTQSGVGTRPFFCPMHQQPALKNKGFFNGEEYPVSENLYQQGFYLPSGLAITESQIERVSHVCKSILK